MTAQSLPRPSYNLPIVDAGGRASRWFAAWIDGATDRLGGDVDAVDAAQQLAAAAAPQSTQIVAAGGLKVGGTLSGDVGLALYAAIGVAASLPTTGLAVGDWAYALDGRKPGEGAAAGTGVPCFWSNGVWNAVTTGAAVTV